MGCDIHIYSEAEIDGKWVMVSAPNFSYRTYALFELLAGVRGDESQALFRPRGLPVDISDGTAANWRYGEGDWHTPSWLYWNELAAVVGQFRRKIGKDYIDVSDYFGFFFGNYIYDRDDWPDFVKNARIVFWFDN